MADSAAEILRSIPAISSFRYSSNDTSKRFTVENPATGAVITTVQAGDEKTTDEAVQAAQKAFENDWRWRPPRERSALLLKAADELEKHAQELAILLCLENGKPWKDALTGDFAFLFSSFRYFGSLADKLPSEFFDQGPIYATVIYEPFGVCAGILPFNWPPIHTGGKLAPALAAGNTMILKPGEQAPLTVMRIVDILQTVLPPDVVQAVPGLGPEVPQALISHSLVKMVSFTGSTAAGGAAARTASLSITPIVLELGGKNAFLIFDDADLDRAARDALEGAFFNKGEACTASSRLLVHKDVYSTFLSRLSAAVTKLRAGSGLDDATHVGPAVSKAQQERVLKYIEVGRQEGATVAAQGSLPSSLELSKGFFVPPTLFSDVTPTMTIAQDEMFGPVATVTRFSTEDEAVGIANASRYGLVAGVYSRDSERAMRVARKLDTGIVFVNNFFRAVLGTPFGGVKESGYGREHWIGTLREWSRVKNIRVPSGLGTTPAWRGVTDIFGTEGSEK
jgi:acyl-CoA reductase-like NAD-dependent aldehyde dehydrogenase